jgi:geranylgeranyl reductase
VLSAFPHIHALQGRFLEATTTRGIMTAPGAPEIAYEAGVGEPPVMYQVRRSVFDRVLLDDALDAGAHLEEGAKVVSAAGSERGWALRLEDGREARAMGVIGAGGAKCPLGRRVRAAARGTPTYPKERLAVSWAREYEVGEDFVDGAYGPQRTSLIVMREGDVTGYAWAFPKREHVNVGFGALVGDLAGVDGRSKADAFARKLSARGLLPAEPRGGAWRAAPIPMGGPAGPVSRPGVLGTGDCAGLVSSLSGDGIHYAILSGRMAASTMDTAIERGDMSAKAMAAYGRDFKRTFNRELAILERVSARLRSDPVEMLGRAERDPSIRSLVVRMFQGEGNLRAMAIRLYGRSLLAGLRR